MLRRELVDEIILKLLSKEIELGRSLYMYEIREILNEYLVENAHETDMRGDL